MNFNLDNLKLPIDNPAAKSNSQVFLADVCVMSGGGRDLRHEDGDGRPVADQRHCPSNARGRGGQDRPRGPLGRD